MNHRNWTKILMTYYAIYEAEMDETKPSPKPKFISWLNNEMKQAHEVVVQLDAIGINPLVPE